MVRKAAVIWAVAVATLLELLVKVSWWRPYCDRQDDGPGAMAFGFPFPYGQPSVALSLTWEVAPLAYAGDIAVLALLAYPLILALRRRLPARNGPPFVALVVLAVALAPIALVFLTGAIVLGPITDAAYGERYWDFRPAAWALRAGHKACERA